MPYIISYSSPHPMASGLYAFSAGDALELALEIAEHGFEPSISLDGQEITVEELKRIAAGDDPDKDE